MSTPQDSPASKEAAPAGCRWRFRSGTDQTWRYAGRVPQGFDPAIVEVEPLYLAPPSPPEEWVEQDEPMSLADIALEECLQLGYSVADGRLAPPDSNEWHALVASRLRAKGLLRG